MFEMRGNFLTNIKNGKVMDSAGYRDRQHNNIGVYKKHGKSNQQFEIVYADEFPATPKMGEMVKEWGFRSGEPFHVKSGLGAGRYLNILGRNMVIKTPNGRKT
jgi:hypothetical protein